MGMLARRARTLLIPGLEGRCSAPAAGMSMGAAVCVAGETPGETGAVASTTAISAAAGFAAAGSAAAAGSDEQEAVPKLQSAGSKGSRYERSLSGERVVHGPWLKGDALCCWKATEWLP